MSNEFYDFNLGHSTAYAYAKASGDLPEGMTPKEYGELLEEPVPPTREGYVFTGWYKDYSCYELWDMENDTIQEDITLFAGWEKKE